MAHTRTWNAAYEANPADGQDINQGATRIRELKQDVQERLALDHVMDETNDDGYHKHVTLEAQGSNPANLAGKARLFTKVVGAHVELFYIDDDAQVFQMTSNGALRLVGTGFAVDTEVVHDTGAETIAGIKTFSATPVGPGGGGMLNHDNANNTEGRIILTTVEPTTVAGMGKGDIKLVY